MPTKTRERKREVLKAIFPTVRDMDDFVDARENFFHNNSIRVSRIVNDCTAYFYADDYKKVAFVNFEVLSSDLKKMVGHANVYWTTR